MTNKGKKKLEDIEKEIVERIQNKSKDTVVAFSLIRLYFLIDDLINNKNHSMLIKLIYVDRKNSAKWAQANDCNIGQRTAFRYRNLYIRLIDILHDENIAKRLILLQEIK